MNAKKVKDVQNLLCYNTTPSSLNSAFFYSKPARSVTVTREADVASGDIWNEKTSLTPFPGKREIEGRNSLKAYELLIYGDKVSIIISYSKNVLKIEAP